MADRYWVGGTESWDGTAGSKWATTSGGTGGEAVPTAADNVFFDANSGAVTVTVSASSVCLDLDFTGFTGTFAGSSALAISGSLTMGAGMTRTYTGTITFNSTSTGETITSNGISFGSAMDFNGVGGEWTLQDTLVSSPVFNFSVSAGSFVTNNQNMTIGVFFLNGTSVRSVSLGSSTVNCSTLSCNTATNLTWDAGTSEIVYSGSFSSFSSVNFYDVTCNASSGTKSTAVNGSIHDLTFNNTGSSYAPTINLQTDLNISNLFTCSGGPLFLRSETISSPKTVTAATVSLNNVSFRDVTAGGASTPWTGTLIGDGGGNSNITFTTPATRYWVGDGGNFGDVAHWSTSSGGAGGASIPLPQDTAIFDASSFSSGSQTTTMNIKCVPTLDFSSVTNSPTLSLNTSGFNDAGFYGDVTLSASMTLSGSSGFEIVGRSSVQNFDMKGLSLGNQLVSRVGSSTTIVLLSDFVSTNSTGLILQRGNLDLNDFDLTLPRLDIQHSTPTISLGSGTITLTGTNTTVFSISDSGSATLNAETSSIVINNTATTTKTFSGGGKTYNNITFSGDNITVSGSNTFNSFNVDNAGLTNGLKLTSGTTQTVSAFTTNGSVGNLAVLQSTSAGSAANLSKSGGVVNVDYMSIKDSTATGGAQWYAGANSTDVSGNTGWIFSAAPTISTVNGVASANIASINGVAKANISLYQGITLS